MTGTNKSDVDNPNKNAGSIQLTVQSAEKEDAGRGIARLPETVRRQLGVLSGDTVVIEGKSTTVAKVWSRASTVPEGAVLIDADTRANANVKIGETVHVTKGTVTEAKSVMLRAPPELAKVDIDHTTIEKAVAKELIDRPIKTGEGVRIERLAGSRFTVADTELSGTVRVTDDTTITVEPLSDTTESNTNTEDTSKTNGDGTPIEVTEADTTSPDKTPETDVTYEDIGGLDEELELIRELIELPLSEPEVFTQLGVEPPKGVLLHGPPGTGKTLIAKAVANEVDATFLTVSGPEIMSKYKGQSEEQLREKFNKAAEEAPAIIFFDEIDSLATARDEGGDAENRIVGQLLSLMDGLNARGDVIVIGATNRVDTLDPALRRGGRFDREIEIGVPGEAGRREILDVHTRQMPLAETVDVDAIAERTHGFVGADLNSLAKETAMTALRRTRQTDDDIDHVSITRDDFETAMTAVEPSAMREYVAEQPTTDFSDVGGLSEAKQQLEQAVTWPLTYGPLFDAAGTTPPTGMLLHGAPGTGKTLLARATAGESQINFIQVQGPELLDRYVGQSEESVREIFERAREAAPAIVFFDEIDAIAGDRDGLGGDSSVGERVVSQLLTEFDRISENPNIVVLAATNRRESLDEALLRAGRLERSIEITEPDEDTRRAILDVHTAEKPLGEDVDLDSIAATTEGATGAELTALCREAALLAITDITDEHGSEAANEHADELTLTVSHFETARKSVIN